MNFPNFPDGYVDFIKKLFERINIARENAKSQSHAAENMSIGIDAKQQEKEEAAIAENVKRTEETTRQQFNQLENLRITDELKREELKREEEAKLYEEKRAEQYKKDFQKTELDEKERQTKLEERSQENAKIKEYDARSEQYNAEIDQISSSVDKVGDGLNVQNSNISSGYNNFYAGSISVNTGSVQMDTVGFNDGLNKNIYKNDVADSFNGDMIKEHAETERKRREKEKAEKSSSEGIMDRNEDAITRKESVVDSHDNQMSADIVAQAKKMQQNYDSSVQQGLSQDETAAAVTRQYNQSKPYIKSILEISVGNCMNVIDAETAKEDFYKKYDSYSDKEIRDLTKANDINPFKDGDMKATYICDGNSIYGSKDNNTTISEDKFIEAMRAAKKEDANYSKDDIYKDLKENGFKQEYFDTSTFVTQGFSEETAKEMSDLIRTVAYNSNATVGSLISKGTFDNVNEMEALDKVVTSGIGKEQLLENPEILSDIRKSLDTQFNNYSAANDGKYIDSNGVIHVMAANDMLHKKTTTEKEEELKQMAKLKENLEDIGTRIANGTSKEIEKNINNRIEYMASSLAKKPVQLLKKGDHATDNSHNANRLGGYKMFIAGAFTTLKPSSTLLGAATVNKELILKNLSKKDFDSIRKLLHNSKLTDADIMGLLQNNKSVWQLFVLNNKNSVLSIIKARGGKITGLEKMIIGLNNKFTGTRIGRFLSIRENYKTLLLSTKTRLGMLFKRGASNFGSFQRSTGRIIGRAARNLSSAAGFSISNKFGVNRITRFVGNVHRGKFARLGRRSLIRTITGKAHLKVLKSAVAAFAKAFKAIAAAIDKATNAIPFYNVIKLVVKIVIAVCIILFACFCTGGLTYNQTASVGAFGITVGGEPLQKSVLKDKDGNVIDDTVDEYSLAEDMLINLDYLFTRNMDSFAQQGLMELISPSKTEEGTDAITHDKNSYTMQGTTYHGVSYPSGPLSMIVKDPTNTSARTEYIYNPKESNITSGYYKDFYKLNLSGLTSITGEAAFFGESANRIGTYIYNYHPKAEHSIYYVSIDGTIQYNLTKYQYISSGSTLLRQEIKVNTPDDDDGDNVYFADSTNSEGDDIGLDNLTYFENNREIIAMGCTMLQNDFAYTTNKDNSSNEHSSTVDFAVYTYNLWLNSHYCDVTEEGLKGIKDNGKESFGEWFISLFKDSTDDTITQYNNVTENYKTLVKNKDIYLSRLGVASDTDNGNARNLIVPLDKNKGTADVAHYLSTPLSLVAGSGLGTITVTSEKDPISGDSRLTPSSRAYHYTFDAEYLAQHPGESDGLDSTAGDTHTTTIEASYGVAGLTKKDPWIISPTQNLASGDLDDNAWSPYAEGTKYNTGSTRFKVDDTHTLKVVKELNRISNTGTRDDKFVAGELYEDYNSVVRDQTSEASGQSYNSYADARNALVESIWQMYTNLADTFGLTVGEKPEAYTSGSDTVPTLSVSYSASSIHGTSCGNPGQIIMTEANLILANIASETEEKVSKNETDTNYLQYTIKEASVPNKYAVKVYDNYVETVSGTEPKETAYTSIVDCRSGDKLPDDLGTITGLESLNKSEVKEQTFEGNTATSPAVELDKTSTLIYNVKTETPNNVPVPLTEIDALIDTSILETTESTYSGKYYYVGQSGDDYYYAKYDYGDDVTATAKVTKDNFNGTRDLTREVTLKTLKPVSYLKLEKSTKNITVTVPVTVKIKYKNAKSDTNAITTSVTPNAHGSSYYAGFCFIDTQGHTHPQKSSFEFTKSVDEYKVVENVTLPSDLTEPPTYVQQYSINWFQDAKDPTGQYIINGAGIHESMVTMHIPCGGHTELSMEPVILTFNGSITMFDVDGFNTDGNAGEVAFKSAAEGSDLRKAFNQRRLEKVWQDFATALGLSDTNAIGTTYTDFFANDFIYREYIEKMKNAKKSDEDTEESTEEATTEAPADEDGDNSAADEEMGESQIGLWNYEISDGEEYRLEAVSMVESNWVSQYNVNWKALGKESNKRANEADMLVDEAYNVDDFASLSSSDKTNIRSKQQEDDDFPRYVVTSQLSHSENNQLQIQTDTVIDESGNIIYGTNDLMGPIIAETVTKYSNDTWNYQVATPNGSNVSPGYYYKGTDSSKHYDLDSLLFDESNDENKTKKMSSVNIRWKNGGKNIAINRINRIRRMYQFYGKIGYSRSARYYFCSTGNPIGMNWKESDIGLIYKTDDVGFAMYAIGDDPRYATNDEMQKLTPELVRNNFSGATQITVIGTDESGGDRLDNKTTEESTEETTEESTEETTEEGEEEKKERKNPEEEFNKEEFLRSPTTVTGKLTQSVSDLTPGDLVYIKDGGDQRVYIYLYKNGNTCHFLSCQPSPGYGKLGPGGVTEWEALTTDLSGKYDAIILSIDKDAVDDTQYRDMSYWLVAEDVNWSHWTIGYANSGNYTVGEGVDGMLDLAEKIANADNETDMDGAPFHYIWGGGHDNGDGPYGAELNTCLGANYSNAGSNRYYGFDCSGFVYNMAKASGLYSGGSILAGQAHTAFISDGWTDITEAIRNGSETFQPGDIWEYEKGSAGHIIIIGRNGNKIHAAGHNSCTCQDSIIVEPYNADSLIKHEGEVHVIRYTGK